jgi:hypothetical protein
MSLRCCSGSYPPHSTSSKRRWGGDESVLDAAEINLDEVE